MPEDCSSLKTISLSIPFSSTITASQVQEILKVDKEHKNAGVLKEITAKDENLFIKFNGADLKKLRVAVNSTIKNILLIVKTYNQFPNFVDNA